MNMNDPRINISSSGSGSGSNASLVVPSTASTGATGSSWLASCLCRAMQVCQSFVVIVLAAAVVILGLQVRALQLQVQAENDKIDTLQKQVANQHQNQQDLNERVEQEHSLTLYQMAGTFALLTCLLTAFHIAQHLSNFHEAVVQRKIIAILWMSPIYSITSFLSLVFPSADGYLAIIKDFYEAYTVYTFLSFLIAVLGRGNRETAVQVLARHADHLKPPTRCLSSFYYPPPETSPTAMANAVLMECQILAMQFVLVRPVTSIIYFVTETLTVPHGASQIDADADTTTDSYAYFKSPNFYIAMITNISVFFAFNGLLKFYHVVREDLRWCQPFNKFLSVKAIVFLTFWQGLTISILVSIHYGAGSGGGASSSWTGSKTAATIGSAPMSSPAHVAWTSLAPTLAPIGTVPLTPTTLVTQITVPPTPFAPTSIEGATGDLLNPNSDSEDAIVNNSTRYRRRMVDDTRSTTHSNSTWSSASSSDRSSEDSKDDTQSSHERANQIQNFLICLEMLFFSMAHYCVFPAEEWKPDYRPKQHYAKPGIGLKDFVKDFSYIMTSSSSARRRAAYHRQGSTNNDDVSSATDADDTEQPANGVDARRFEEYTEDSVSLDFANGAKREDNDSNVLSHGVIS